MLLKGQANFRKNQTEPLKIKGTVLETSLDRFNSKESEEIISELEFGS